MPVKFSADMSVEEMEAGLDFLGHDLADALDPDRRARALEEVVKPFQKGGQYAYVPAKEGLRPATEKFLKEEELRANVKLFYLEDFARKVPAVLASLKAQAMRPPTIEENFRARRMEFRASPADFVQLLQLEELFRMRVSGEVRSSLPPHVLARYTEAVADPDDLSNGAAIRVIEQVHGNGWNGPTFDHEAMPGELVAVQQLARAIKATREARIPENVRQLEARLVEAERAIGKAKRLHRLNPLNPAHNPALASVE